MDPLGELIDRALFPAWEGLVRGRPTLRLLRYLRQTEVRPLDELEAIQLGALRRLLRHAFEHVPFYRARMEEAGLLPEDVRALSDLARLPLLERGDARAAGDTRKSTAPPFPTIRKATSGSSGEPLSFAYDAGSEHWRQATKLRGYGWAGHRVGTRTLHYWGAVSPGAQATARRSSSRSHALKVALDRGLKRERYLDCGVRGDEELARVVEELRRRPPEVLICYAQAGADLARWINARGARSWPDVTVLTAAERLLPADRAAIVEAFGPRVFETYGSREVMLIASECGAHDGLHLSMENLLVELVVREGEGTRPTRPEEIGEVVITDLHNLGMPFIRYATGDLARMASRARCACGRTLPRLGAVEGRVTESLVDGEGRRVSGLLFNVMMVAHGASIRAFQAVQHRDRAVTLRVVAPDLAEGEERALRESLEPYLRGVPLRIERVADIPTERSGKRRIVVVER